MLTAMSSGCRRAVLAAVAIVGMGACGEAQQTVEWRADDAPGSEEEIGELAPPQRGPGEPPHRPLAATSVEIMPCEQAEAESDAPMHMLPSPPPGAEQVICFVARTVDDLRPADLPPPPVAAHVLYAPSWFDPQRHDSLEGLHAGGVAVHVEVLERGVLDISPPDAPQRDHMGGGFAPADIRGNRSLVKRVHADRVIVVWNENDRGRRYLFSVVGGRSPDELVELARSLRPGVPEQ